MKIDEPDTPYERGDLTEADDDEVGETRASTVEGNASNEKFAADLMSRLGDVAVELGSGAERRDKPWETADEEKERQDRFRQKRNQHYNEFEMMKRWKAEHADDDEDDDDDDDADDGGGDDDNGDDDGDDADDAATDAERSGSSS